MNTYACVHVYMCICTYVCTYIPVLPCLLQAGDGSLQVPLTCQERFA